jgi:hypothetical protein
MLDPIPLGTLIREFVKRFKFGSYQSRLTMGAVDKPYYAYCLYNGALLAKKLGYNGVSVLEFGVAEGNGLLNLEHHAEKIQNLLSINIDVYGFDTSEGLPEPLDYRDLPHHWKKGFFKMDFQKLEAKLKKAKLIIGDVKETVDDFLEKYQPYPIGAIMFDLDFYSSTVSALRIFEGDEKYFLPRVFCFFDDIIGNEVVLFNEYTGERLAINEFNQSHKKKKLSKVYYLRDQKWNENIRIYHNFAHSKYNDFVS